MEKTTDLEKIKELALKHFDAFDISVKPQNAFPMDIDGDETTLIEARCNITHPFFRGNLFANAFPDGEIALYKVIDDPVEFEKVKSKLINDARTALGEVTDPMVIFDSILSQYRMPFIKEAKQFLSPSDRSRVLRGVASSVTGLDLSPSELTQFKADILELFDESFIPQDFMLDAERKLYDALPDVVTVYHGVNEDTEDYEISDVFYWTTEIEQLIPTEDVRPHESDSGVVYEAKIRKEDIYAYLSLDDTVFLNPDKLFNILHHKNYPLDDIELSDKDVVRR